MSSSIWTRCADACNPRPLSRSPWRFVEAQHQVSTRKLVDTLEEQVLLEQLIDSAKPPDPIGRRLHYLLSTPFRYPPLRHGSRFGTRHERGIWYGSDDRRTAGAEVAYYRFVFLDGTRADLGDVSTALTAFTVRMASPRGADLTAPPFDAHRDAIASPVSYAETQALGRSLREAGVEIVRYPSARAPHGGTNVAAFVPSVFGAALPRRLETWQCTANRRRVELSRRDYFARLDFVFERETFLVNGRLPAPAL